MLANLSAEMPVRINDAYPTVIICFLGSLSFRFLGLLSFRFLGSLSFDFLGWLLFR